MHHRKCSLPHSWRRFVIGLSLALTVWAVAATPAHAVAGQTVVGTGTAASCTLAALNSALNSTFDPLLVTFNCGTSPVVIPVTSSITFPNVAGSTTSITIDGGAPGRITLSGSTVRILDQTYLQNLTVKSLTFTGGSATGGACGGVCTGGAISNPRSINTLAVIDSAFTSNIASFAALGANGGAIFSAGPLSVTGSTFSNNQVSAGNGGAIYAFTATITNTRFANNSSAIAGGTGGRGGALYAGPAPVAGNSMQVTGSSFTGNTANDRGGAIYRAASTNVHSFTVANSTFSGNSAQVSGGALSSGPTFGVAAVSVTNATISGNSVVSGTGAGIEGSGIMLTNSIVSNNAPGGNCSASFPDGGGNVVFGDTTCPGTNANPVLGALTGTVPHLPLGAGSAAINRGVASACAAAVGSPSFGAGAVDQRGLPRRIAYCDSGAVEAQAASVSVVAGSNQRAAVSTSFGTVLQAQVSDSFSNSLSGSFVTFTGPTSGAGIASGSVNLSGSSGFAYLGAIANGTVGTYNVTASTPGAPSANFSLTNRNPHALTYSGNGNTGGSVPVDGNYYATAATVTTLGNTGALSRINATFGGWNTAANGSGTGYVGGSTFAINASATLYAQWMPIPTFNVFYNGNGNTGGTPPTDGNAYVAGATVTALGNNGNLVKTGSTFSGWNTAANGSGISYAIGTAFAIGSGNMTLFAKWGNVVTCTLDVDGNGSIDPLTDGLMIVRAMLGFTGTAVTNGVTGGGTPTRATWNLIQPYLNTYCGTNFLP